MKITLLFPPHWAPYQPYLSLPSLTSVLREKGHFVTQRDINIEWVDYFNSTGVMRKSYKKIIDRIEYLKSKAGRGEKEELELKQLLPWEEAGKAFLNLVKGSKDLMRQSDRFFDFNQYRNSCLVLFKAYHLYGDSYFPTMLDFYSLEQKYSRYSTEGIVNAINDPEGNIYFEYFNKITIPSLKENPSDFYGISISAFSQTIPGLTLAGLIKENFPEAHICIGGNVFTRVGPRLLPSSPLFDFFDSVILYEGEVALVKLLDALEKGSSLSSVPNIIYKDKKNGLIYNETVEIPDINKIPPPDYEGLPHDLYLSPFKTFPLLSARGCYWNKCAFCQHKYTYRGGYRPGKIEKVVDDLVFMKETFGCNHFSFNDEAIPPKRLRRLAEEISNRGLDIKWEAYGRVEKDFDEDLAVTLRKAGCSMLSFGLESSVSRVLKLMRKGFDIKVFEKVLASSAGAGIWNYAWFFTGFPSETEEEARETVDFILKNQDRVHSVAIGAVFGLEEYTDIVENPEKYSLKEVKPVKGNDLSFVYDYSVMEGLCPDEAKKLADEFSKKILDNHRQGIIMATMPRVHQFLYVSHYGSNDLVSFI